MKEHPPTNPARMHIAIVNQFYHPVRVGGAEVSVQQIAEGLVAQGHRVSVATTQTGGLPAAESINGVEIRRFVLANVYTWDGKKTRSALSKTVWHTVDSWNPVMHRRFRRWLLEVKPDILHTNTVSGFSASIWHAAKGLNIPIVHTLRDFYLLCVRASMFRDDANCQTRCRECRLLSVPRQWAAKAVDGVVGNSQFMLQRHMESGSFIDTRIRKVIHNAFDGRAASASAPSGEPGQLRLGFLGRIHPSKGVEWLLECLTTSGLTNFTVKLAGDGDPAYLEKLRSKYASERVQFLGFAKPADLFAQIDLLIVPSLWQEPLPRVAFESYACGVPVIVSNRGGSPEIVEPGQTGYVFDPDQPQSLLGILQNIAGSPGLLTTLRAGALAKASEFTRDAIVQKYESTYRELITP